MLFGATVEEYNNQRPVAVSFIGSEVGSNSS